LKLGELRSVRIVPLALTGCEDVAAAAGLDDEDTAWLYVYAVWPNVSLFVTISHPRELPERSWALDALHSLRAGSLLDA
jgi:hypothetical protein